MKTGTKAGIKTGVIVVLGAICAVILAAAVLRVRLLPLGDGERTLVYTAPFGPRPGGSANADLVEALVPLYGGEGLRTERLRCQWQGESAAVYDTSRYDIRYLGRSVAGGNYLSCEVVTVRTVLLADGTAAVPDTRRTCTYVGYDDTIPNSAERARILWETLEEDYSESRDYFDGILLGDTGSRRGG